MSPSNRHLTGRLTLFGICSLALAGCGGGSGGTASGSSGDTQLGLAVVHFLGSAKPMLTSSSGSVSVVGMTSTSSITSVNINPTPNLASTSLLVTREIGTVPAVFIAPFSGGAEVPLTKNGAAALSAVCSSSQLIALIYKGDVWTMHADGTGFRQATSSGFCSTPTFSPGGATMAYVFNSSQIRTVPSTGGTGTTIFTAPSGSVINSAGIAWSPDGTKIAISMTNPTTDFYNIYTIPSTGGTATDVSPTNDRSKSWISPSWSSDSQAIVATSVSTNFSVALFQIVGTSDANPYTPSGFSDSNPAVSPDGTKLAFYRSSAGGATPGVYVSTFYGTDPNLVIPDPSGSGSSGAVISLDWTPFLPNQNFVGTSIAQVSTTPVTGFLMAQNGSQFASMFSFTATTPSTAAISTPVTTGTQPLIFTISADSITNIAWTNVYSGAKSSQTLTGTPSMVVSVDAVTGKIDLVAPALARAKATMSARMTVVYSGKFSAVYDNAGKNLAPRGASRIELDPTSGKAVSVG